ncbi:MAG: hypothetical protein PF450_15195, partial [Bacteroidales bacterium]|nr:hypothetical protein [Bacteroidales bacterium]
DKLIESSKVMGYRLTSELDNSVIQNKGLDAFYNSSTVQYEYLKSIGKAIKTIFKKKPVLPAYIKKFKGNPFEIMGMPEFKEAVKTYYNDKAKELEGIIDKTDLYFNKDGEVYFRFIDE